MPTHVSAGYSETLLLHLNNEKGRHILDVLSAFWNVPMAEEDIASTGLHNILPSQCAAVCRTECDEADVIVPATSSNGADIAACQDALIDDAGVVVKAPAWTTNEIAKHAFAEDFQAQCCMGTAECKWQHRHSCNFSLI